MTPSRQPRTASSRNAICSTERRPVRTLLPHCCIHRDSRRSGAVAPGRLGKYRSFRSRSPNSSALRVHASLRGPQPRHSGTCSSRHAVRWSGCFPRRRSSDRAPVPNRSLLGDSAYIRSVIEEIDGPVLLAGHSYGGAVITVAGLHAPPPLTAARRHPAHASASRLAVTFTMVTVAITEPVSPRTFREPAPRAASSAVQFPPTNLSCRVAQSRTVQSAPWAFRRTESSTAHRCCCSRASSIRPAA